MRGGRIARHDGVRYRSRAVTPNTCRWSPQRAPVLSVLEGGVHFGFKLAGERIAGCGSRKGPPIIGQTGDDPTSSKPDRSIGRELSSARGSRCLLPSPFSPCRAPFGAPLSDARNPVPMCGDVCIDCRVHLALQRSRAVCHPPQVSEGLTALEPLATGGCAGDGIKAPTWEIDPADPADAASHALPLAQQGMAILPETWDV